jgi:hypothetical protein
MEVDEAGTMTLPMPCQRFDAISTGSATERHFNNKLYCNNKNNLEIAFFHSIS